MFITSTKEISSDSLLRADFTGHFLIITSINLNIGLPTVVQFRCSHFYLKELINALSSLEDIKVIDNGYDTPLILQDRLHVKNLYVAQQCLAFYSLPDLRNVLLSVYEQYEVLE